VVTPTEVPYLSSKGDVTKMASLAQQYAVMTQPDFNQLLHDNPEWFRIETRALNASHKGEAK
jgi:hypothetical protein